MDAIDLIWGTEKEEVGKDASLKPVDFNSLFEYVRRQLGYPTVPVELTTEQLNDILTEAVTEYNRWRNFNENIVYVNLPSNSPDGYDIPAAVGAVENIIDVIVRPRLPFGYLAADPEMASSIYMQYFFQKYGRPGQSGFLSDYWIALSTLKDTSLILGTEPRWDIINRKLIITPKPTVGALAVGIKYKSAITMDEVLTDNLIKRYMKASAKILLGTIRGTFGGVIPGGAENINLNHQDLMSQGNTDLMAVMEEMKKQMAPLEMLIG